MEKKNNALVDKLSEHYQTHNAGSGYTVGIHVLKSHANACLNRGVDNSPKTTVYGNTTRAMITSQNIKKTARDNLQNYRLYQIVPKSVRTRNVPELIYDRLAATNIDPHLLEALHEILTLYYSLSKGCKAIRPYTENEISTNIDRIMDWAKDKSVDDLNSIVKNLKDMPAESGKMNDQQKELIKTLGDYISIEDIYDFGVALDIALFGRMVVIKDSIQAKSTPAAVSVAHAFSTHEVQNCEDFYTATDEYQETASSAYLDTHEHNSALMYEFMSFDVDQAMKNLEFLDRDDRIELIKSSIQSLITILAMATSKSRQAGNATNEFPEAVYVEVVKKDNGYAKSYAGAFEAPVESDPNGGYAAPSIKAFQDRLEECAVFDCYEPEKRFWVSLPKYAFHNDLVQNCTFNQMLKEVVNSLNFN